MIINNMKLAGYDLKSYFFSKFKLKNEKYYASTAKKLALSA